MGYFINGSGGYYEGDRLDASHQSVPQRPSGEHELVAGDWAVPITKARAKVRGEIVKARNEAITGGFPYLGKLIDSDRDSVMLITGAAVAALAAKAASLPYAVVWTCADDSALPLDADGVLGMAVALAMFADAQHEKARPLKEAIAAENDPEKIKKVKW